MVTACIGERAHTRDLPRCACVRACVRACVYVCLYVCVCVCVCFACVRSRACIRSRTCGSLVAETGGGAALGAVALTLQEGTTQAERYTSRGLSSSAHLQRGPLGRPCSAARA